MIFFRQKLYYERTREMEEASEQWRILKSKTKEKLVKTKDAILHPTDSLNKLGNKISGKYRSYKADPNLLKQDVKKAGQKAWKFAKENPRDVAYLGANEFVLPVLTKKLVTKSKGRAAGLTAAATVAALPLGESAIALDHFVRSKPGKSFIKAGGQHIKGAFNDLTKKKEK